MFYAETSYLGTVLLKRIESLRYKSPSVSQVTLMLLFARLNFKLKGGTDSLDICLLGHLDIWIDKSNIHCSPNN